MSIHVANAADFQKEVLENNGTPVLVDFYADWCGPCQAMLPVVEELAEQLSGEAKVVKVNVDQTPELAARYQVRSIPNFVVIKNGEVQDRFIGAQPRSVLLDAVNSHLN